MVAAAPDIERERESKIPTLVRQFNLTDRAPTQTHITVCAAGSLLFCGYADAGRREDLRREDASQCRCRVALYPNAHLRGDDLGIAQALARILAQT